MDYNFRNLIFEGGGVKGLAYVGAMEVLEEKGILQNIIRVGGTSAGAINAVLLALGYSNAETKKILSELNFNNFMDRSEGLFGVFGDIKRLWKKYGWNKGDFFQQWIGELIENKTGSSQTTFAQLYSMGKEKNFKELYIVGTNLSTHFSEVFSYEKTPDMPIAEAVRISMSIPLFFASKKSARGDIYVDGGVLLNYPVKLFDRERYVQDNKIETDYYKTHNEDLKQKGINISKYVYNKETLGFRLDSRQEMGMFRDQKQPVSREVKNFSDFARGLVATMTDSQLNAHLHSDDWQRTIYIDASMAKTTEFDLSDEKKLALIESGRQGIKKYFQWYDNNPAINK